MTKRWKEMLDNGDFDLFESEMERLHIEIENLRRDRNVLADLANSLLRKPKDDQAKLASDEWLAKHNEVIAKEKLLKKMREFSRNWAWKLFNRK